jgi:drug/metabolite transporter (DMT)-like permease
MSTGGDTSSPLPSGESITLISSLLGWVQPTRMSHMHNQLLLAAIYFALGFLLTNYGFMLGSTAFVETIKAGEPFTSASVAVLWGIEQLGLQEVLSLSGIVMGVTLSTLGHGKSSSAQSTSSSSLISHEVETDDNETMIQHDALSPSLITICFIVMASNLCFSLRGLHQKLFRATPQGHVLMMNDLNLQYRMQQVGVLMLIVPTLLENTALIIDRVHRLLLGRSAVKTHAIQYMLLSLTNGVAFTSYNLASTYVLTKISVVHHAALNCIRRVFAIVVTSIIFGLTITSLQVTGIGMAVAGFFSYIHFKMMKERKESRRKELRRKWGGFLVDGKDGKWNGKKNSSLLPLNSTAK